MIQEGMGKKAQETVKFNSLVDEHYSHGKALVQHAPKLPFSRVANTVVTNGRRTVKLELAIVKGQVVERVGGSIEIVYSFGLA